MATKPSNSNVNVFQKPLALFSQKPMTGFFRDGYCRTGSEDGGSHVIAGEFGRNSEGEWKGRWKD